eukprot:scaffold3272_cov239-Pinguiococcus_pyrenoidosus.AAC.4
MPLPRKAKDNAGRSAGATGVAQGTGELRGPDAGLAAVLVHGNAPAGRRRAHQDAATVSKLR